MAKEIAGVKPGKAEGALGNARVSREDILRMGEALELGLPITKVAALVGKSPRTVRRYIDGEGRSDGSVYKTAAYLKRQQQKGVLHCLKLIRDAAEGRPGPHGKAHNWQAAAWLLERCHGYTVLQQREPALQVNNIIAQFAQRPSDRVKPVGESKR